MVNLQTNARIAAAQGLEASLRSAASIWHMYCVTRSPCGCTSGFYHLSHGGKTYLIQNGYPEAGDVIGGDQIDTMITQSGFDIALPDNLTTRFAVQGAADPVNCSVSYRQALAPGQEPLITLVTSGC